MNSNGDGILVCYGHSEDDGNFMPKESQNREAISRHTEEQHLQSDTNISRHTEQSEVSHSRENITNNAILRGLNNCSPQKDETKHVIVSERETIQSIVNQNQLQGNKYAPTSKSKISVLPQGVDMSTNSLAPKGRGQGEGLKAAFTEPSRGMSGAKVEQTSAETLSFRCVCERCRLTRGDVGKSKYKVAFTLAEVLITLGIIGVVAAMTLPTIINNIQSHELQVALNKGYAEISQALELMKNDIGTDILPANYAGREFAPIYKNYFKNLKYSKYSNILESVWEDKSPTTQRYDNYLTYNKSATVMTECFDDGQFILNDGTLILIDNPDVPYSNRRIFITIDINGYNKKPNVYGRDLFTFQITRAGKLLPMGAEGTIYTNMSRFCSKTSSDRMNGIACTYKALTDKDYFKKMY